MAACKDHIREPLLKTLLGHCDILGKCEFMKSQVLHIDVYLFPTLLKINYIDKYHCALPRIECI